MNSGHTRPTAFVIRCRGDAKDPRFFSTWAAIALAGIGKLPTTLADRSIEIKLKRKTETENAEGFDRSARAALGELARKIVRWQSTIRPRYRARIPRYPFLRR